VTSLSMFLFETKKILKTSQGPADASTKGGVQMKNLREAARGPDWGRPSTQDRDLEGAEEKKKKRTGLLDI